MARKGSREMQTPAKDGSASERLATTRDSPVKARGELTRLPCTTRLPPAIEEFKTRLQAQVDVCASPGLPGRKLPQIAPVKHLAVLGRGLTGGRQGTAPQEHLQSLSHSRHLPLGGSPPAHGASGTAPDQGAHGQGCSHPCTVLSPKGSALPSSPPGRGAVALTQATSTFLRSCRLCRSVRGLTSCSSPQPARSCNCKASLQPRHLTNALINATVRDRALLDSSPHPSYAQDLLHLHPPLPEPAASPARKKQLFHLLSTHKHFQGILQTLPSLYPSRALHSPTAPLFPPRALGIEVSFTYRAPGRTPPSHHSHQIHTFLSHPKELLALHSPNNPGAAGRTLPSSRTLRWSLQCCV